MQTRKRAKSVTFGKKEKKEEVKKPAEPIVTDAEKTSEKAEVVERRTVPEKTLPDELSATPPKVDEKSETPEVTTPTNEFITDNPASAPTEAPKVSANTTESTLSPVSPVKTDEQPAVVDASLQSSLSPEKP